jgi:hypothetical protein
MTVSSEPPLAAYYRIDDADRKVFVLSVGLARTS